MECVFCDIVEGNLGAERVYEDEETLAFLDARPASDGHILVVPKHHFTDIAKMSEKDKEELFNTVNKVSDAVEKTLQPEGINILQSDGEDEGEKVQHVHIHIVPKHTGDKIHLNFNTDSIKEGEELTERIKTYINS